MAATERLAVEHRSSTSSRWAILAALAIFVALVAFVSRIATEDAPALAIHRMFPAEIRLPGSSPVLGWPLEGQAAVEVEGVGSFGTSGGSTPVPIASVAKVMTAYLTLREHPIAAGQSGFTMTVTASEEEEAQRRQAEGQSIVRVARGERLTERQALEALLLPSANNIAAMLAVYDAGGSSAFVARMNTTASRLGMRSTTYTDPSGFEPSTVSTAADQLRLARAAMRDPTFASIVAESSTDLPVAGRVGNFDGLVGEDGYVGIKTGSDRAAGGCLLFAKHFTVAGRTLTVLGAVLGQREGSLIDAALAAARRLGDSAAAATGVRVAVPARTTVLTATATDGRETKATTNVALRTIGWAGLELPVRVIQGAPRSHVRVGERLGNVTLSGLTVARTDVVARGSLGGPSLGWRLQHVL